MIYKDQSKPSMEASAISEKSNVEKTKNGSNKVKQCRGTSLSKQQYEILFNFLKFGAKPDSEQLKSAVSSGSKSKIDVGPSRRRSPLSNFRFKNVKSIAKRLKISTTGKEIVFRSNGKIVVPNNRFDEVITAAHCNNGTNHLNISKTIEKVRNSTH